MQPSTVTIAVPRRTHPPFCVAHYFELPAYDIAQNGRSGSSSGLAAEDGLIDLAAAGVRELGPELDVPGDLE